MKKWLNHNGKKFLKEIGIKKNQTILDFGCRYGTYTIPASLIVGDKGLVYSVDKNKEALDKLEQKITENNLNNIQLINTEKSSNLPFRKKSIDVVLLYDVLHLIENKKSLLDKMYNFLKPNGILSLYPKHHENWMDMSLDGIIDLVNSRGFVFDKKICNT